MSKGLVVALSGGVGGAKLALGLSRVLPADELLVVANTGDDFEHLGLSISPDIDTLTYVLAGLDNTEQGWGRRDETWSFMATIASVGGADWFRLGDRDLALHVERTRRLHAGETLSQVTADITRRLGVANRILPMSDDRVRTRVRSDDGWIDFQDYFVRQQCRPVVRELAFDGAATARPQPEVMTALGGQVRAVVICPSNPFISIEPILAVPGVRAALEDCGAPVVASLADRRRQGGQGTDRQDDAGARARRECRVGGGTLRRPARRLHRRPGRCARHRRQGAHRPHSDDDASPTRKRSRAPRLPSPIRRHEQLRRTSGRSCRSRSWTAPSNVSPPCSPPRNAAR